MPDTSSLITEASAMMPRYDPASWNGFLNGPLAAGVAAGPSERAWTCGYDSGKYDGERFRRKVRKLTEDLDRVLTVFNADAIVVYGTSGTSVAFGMQALGNLPLVMVRKPGEGSHGHAVEGNPGRFRRYVFLDDFVSSGATVHRVRGLLSNATMVALWLHQGADERYATFRTTTQHILGMDGAQEISLPCVVY